MKITIAFEPPELCRQCKFREHYRTNKGGNAWRCKLYGGIISNSEYYNDKRIDAGCLTETELNTMLHSIGYEPEKVRRGKYKPHRNYYCTIAGDEAFTRLLQDGLVTEHKGDSIYVNYSVTSKGFTALEKYLCCKIDEQED